MIGQRLGNWRLQKELGRGGMGWVFLAQEEGQASSRKAAVKVLSAELAGDAGFLSRFQREIEVLRELNHPNIVKLYDSGQQSGHYYYVMEFVEGRSFEELLVERGRLPWQEVLDLALQVCPALKHAHDRGVIHRDLKPSNLLRTAVPTGSDGFGAVKLTDFGIAHVFARPHLTATGGIIGTAEYLSPEQAIGKPVTKRSDLYSLGVVLYTLLTGRNPFQGESVVEILHKHRYAQFDQPRKLVPEIPYDLEEIVCRLLEKDPANRPGDGMVLQRQLESVRRKLERKQQSEPMALDITRLEKPPGVVPDNPGPATLMSQLMRRELDRQNLGGPVSRFLHKPWVLVTLFVLCVGLIVWGLWPASAASLYEHGAKLMQSEDPQDWDTADGEYFKELDEKFPDHKYKEQVAQYRAQINEHREHVRAAKLAKQESMTEIQWVRRALDRAKQRREANNQVDANAIYDGLEIQYRDNPAVLEEIKQSRK